MLTKNYKKEENQRISIMKTIQDVFEMDSEIIQLLTKNQTIKKDADFKFSSNTRHIAKV